MMKVNDWTKPPTSAPVGSAGDSGAWREEALKVESDRTFGGIICAICGWSLMSSNQSRQHDEAKSADPAHTSPESAVSLGTESNRQLKVGAETGFDERLESDD